jgi:hypothetical protein
MIGGVRLSLCILAIIANNQTIIPNGQLSLASQSAEVLATFSTLGFVIFLALPALISVRWDSLKGSRDITVLFDPIARFQGSFTSKRVYLSFVSLSLAFMGSGILLLFNFLLPSEIAIHVAVITQFVSLITASLLVIYIYAKANYVSVDDLAKAVQYATAKPPNNSPRRLTRQNAPSHS